MLSLLAAVVMAHAPKLKYKWIYLGTNFFVEKNVDDAIKVAERGAAVGYNGIVYTDTKLQSLETYPDFYVKNFKRFATAARKVGMKIIPCVYPVGYADGMLAHDPTLVESMPCKDVPFVAKGNQLVPVLNPLVTYKNGNFEQSNGDRFAGFGFQDGPGVASFADKTVTHEGSTSMRIENPDACKESNGNVRIMQRIPADPWRQYRLSAWIKTEKFTNAGSVRFLAADPKVHPLCFQEMGIQPTQDWTKVQVVFNTQENKELAVYFGVWSGGKGKLWVDDIKLEEVPLLNITRRPGCPLRVKGTGGITYAEATDFAPIKDPKFGNIPWSGEFEMGHEPPAVGLTDITRIRSGETVWMSYYTATTVMGGQSVLCMSEPASDRLMQAEMNNVAQLTDPDGIFLSHDEIRVLDWCQACQDRHLTPGQLLAANVKQCTELAQKSKKGVPIFAWSDMFDPFHNAVDDYYLANGSLKNSWLGLAPEVVVVNWNSGKQKESLDFFAKRGHRQILAGYYDAPVDAIKEWMKNAQATGSLDGVMYTTWVGNYTDLEAFAKAAWGNSR